MTLADQKISNHEKVELYQLKPLSTAEHIEQLENYFKQRVWLSPMANLNDPFEGHYKLLLPAPHTIKTGSTEFNRHLNFFKNNGNPTLTAEDFDNLLRSDDYNTRVRIMMEKSIKDTFLKHGVLCFIRTQSNIPMWAHYGSNHKGYCLIYEFDFCAFKTFYPEYAQFKLEEMLSGEKPFAFQSKVESSLWFSFTKVHYSNAIPTIVFDELQKIENEHGLNSYIIRNSISVKFDQWDYEKECRLIANLSCEPGQLMELPKYTPFLKITGVVMGAKLEESTKEIFHSLCRQYGMNLFQARCSETEYKIEIERVSIKNSEILTKNEKQPIEA